MADFSNLHKDIGGIASALANRRMVQQQRSQGLQDALRLYQMKRDIDQRYATPGAWKPTSMQEALDYERAKQNLDPMANILRMGKVAEAFGNLGIDPTSVMGQTGGVIDVPYQDMSPGEGAKIGQFSPSKDIVATDYKITPFGKLVPTKFKDISVSAKEQAGKDKSEKLGKKFGELNRVVGAMRNLQRQFKMIDEEFGATGTKAAMTYDLGRLRYAPSFLKKAAAPLQGAQAQTEEVSIGLLPILSGQARYIESLGERIKRTVPDISIIPETRNDLMAQSIRNMMTMAYAIKNGFLTEEKLREMGIDPSSEVQSDKEIAAVLSGIQLSSKEEKSIEDAIEYVLGAKAVKSYGEEQTKDIGMSVTVEEIKNARKRGATGYDTSRGVFVDQDGNPI